jgi:hypothetical protein
MIDGWPAHTGPLQVLAELGNVPAGTTPQWLNEPTHEIDSGRVGYKCRTHRGLSPETILDLAALIIEGYQVWILPRGRYARINILEPEGTN